METSITTLRNSGYRLLMVEGIVVSTQRSRP
jgi:hypothetical protein